MRRVTSQTVSSSIGSSRRWKQSLKSEIQALWPAKAKILMTSLLALSGVYLTILICSWVRRTSVSPRLATQNTRQSNFYWHTKHGNYFSKNVQNTRTNALPTLKNKHGNHFSTNTQNTSQLSPNTKTWSSNFQVRHSLHEGVTGLVSRWDWAGE